ncbi:autophagy-related protein 18g-like isoform X1 [Primulina huaijiensis]|uniref:autophagy-related protein 18g-like isoform X1 n=1 Tax=Primulina huaijiensis TaxID=1492673 RepID=UPI003CC6E954
MRRSKGKNSKLLPYSLRIISSCIKTVSTNASTAVRSAGASVAASISSSGDDRKEQVLWAGFDKLELSPTALRHVLLIGYLKGFQVFDVEDACNFIELVSRRYGPVTFLQILPAPANCNGAEVYKKSHPMLVVVGGDDNERITRPQNTRSFTNGATESSIKSSFDPPSTVRFYSMKLNEYVKVVDFKSAVFMVRCSLQVVAIGLEEQVYCFDALTLEKKFLVVTYPVPRSREQVPVGMGAGYGPMAVGPRWLAYPPNRPFMLNTGRMSPKNLSSSVSPSTSPGNGTLMARYAVESSRHLAAGILTLGDMGYKRLSKYCPELLHESPSSPGWKIGKLAASEPENAGVVAVKDLVSSEVISQFRAHTSPISALCFDPSGTLLVTASVHGNKINVFRILPSHKGKGSGCNDWSTSHVHLYKLYRGITTAVIQDICFSKYSQWIAIISSRGTCHIFVLSPFGGDDGIQALQTHEQGTLLYLASSPPWWSTSSFTTNEQHYSPPHTCTLSIVTRIKCSDSGLLNSVSNAAASMVGNTSVPSGAISAVFHNSKSTGSLDVLSSSNALEHILVYTPSGFAVQYEIQSPLGVELSECRTNSWSTAQVNPQHEEFRVKVDPAQWWDVCRRLDDLEIEEFLSGIFHGENAYLDNSKIDSQEECSGKKELVKSDTMKSAERTPWYLSNAEVQINSCRLPIWQKSKIHFRAMEPPRVECYFGGEFEIEMLTSHELEIRHKDLLPVFDHYSSARPGWTSRSVSSDGRYHSASTDSCQAREATGGPRIISHSNPPSDSSTENSGGMEKAEDFGHFFKEGYCSKPELGGYHDSTEVATEEVDDTGASNTHDEEEKSEEGWIGGMFDFSEDG